MKRFITSIILGVVVTFGLFVFMAFLISSGSSPDDVEKEKIVVEINSTPPDSKTQQRKLVPPPPPPPPKAPPPPDQPEPEQQISDSGFNFNMPSVNVGGSIGLSGPGALLRDGDATPIVRIEPKFPTKAARDGIEGWVQLSFEINKIGGVENVQVINAQPKRVFDREARKALRKWKYKPKMVDGKPQHQTGLSVQLDFKLGN